jgi:hypothetical protein
VLHVLECVAAPCLVGSVMYQVFEFWDRRRRRRRKDDGLPSVDYLI